MIPVRCRPCILLLKMTTPFLTPSWKTRASTSELPRRIFTISLTMAALLRHRMYLSSFPYPSRKGTHRYPSSVKAHCLPKHRGSPPRRQFLKQSPASQRTQLTIDSLILWSAGKVQLSSGVWGGDIQTICESHSQTIPALWQA